LTDMYVIIWFGCGFMMFNVTFNNISAVSWSFIGGETGVSGQNTDMFRSVS